jgi:hypothetical protein
LQGSKWLVLLKTDRGGGSLGRTHCSPLAPLARQEGVSAPWPRSVDELEAANCAFAADSVSRRPDVTEFKRRARWQQAWWREQHGLPIGSHRPPGSTSRTLNGSRVDLDYARESRCNFLSPAIQRAVEDRLAHPQLHQTLNEDRLWSDLLSSMPLCFNLFGDLHGDTGEDSYECRPVVGGPPGGC